VEAANLKEKLTMITILAAAAAVVVAVPAFAQESKIGRGDAYVLGVQFVMCL
jgi:hypothetical protein